MGCPIVISMPGINARSSRRACRNCSLFFSPSSKETSISDDSTPWECSSSSALPVRRATDRTSGWLRIVFSAIAPRESDSASEVPGRVTALMVNAPSLNWGRNEWPRKVEATMAAMRSAPLRSITTVEWRSTGASTFSYPCFKIRARVGSWDSRMPLLPGRSR